MAKSKKNTKAKQDNGNLDPIPRASGATCPTEPWRILEEEVGALVQKDEAKYGHLRDLRFALLWKASFQTDPDGIALGATVKLPSETDRILFEREKAECPDVILTLPRDVWQYLTDTEKHRRLFVELHRIRPKMDPKTHEPKRSKNGRILLRLARYPIRTFPEEIETFGLETVLGQHAANAAAVVQLRKFDPDALEADKKKAPLLADQIQADQDADRASETPHVPGQDHTLRVETCAANDDAEGSIIPISTGVQDPRRWRRWTVAKLDTAETYVEYLRDAGVGTIGKLKDLLDAGKTKWDRQISASGQKKPAGFKTAVEAAMTAFWKVHRDEGFEV